MAALVQHPAIAQDRRLIPTDELSAMDHKATHSELAESVRYRAESSHPKSALKGGRIFRIGVSAMRVMHWPFSRSSLLHLVFRPYSIGLALIRRNIEGLNEEIIVPLCSELRSEPNGRGARTPHPRRPR